MSWCRGFLLFAALVVLGACGFHPLYGKADSKNAPKELASVEIKPIPDRIGQILHNHLLDLMNSRGRPSKPAYALTVNLSEGTEHLAVRKSAFVTRANLRVSANFTLTERSNGKALYSGKTLVVSGYDILSSDFATMAAEKDARERAVTEIGYAIRLKLAVFFSQRKSE